MRSWLKFILPIVVTSGGLFGVYTWLKPTVRNWASDKISEYCHANLPFDIEIKDLNWTIFLPRITLSKVIISPKTGQGEGLSPIFIEKILADIDVLYLISGRLNISKVYIIKSDINITIPSRSGDSSKTSLKASPLPVPVIFQTLQKLPLKEVVLINPHVKIQSWRSENKSNDFDLEIMESILSFKNRKNNVLAQARITSAKSTWQGHPFDLKLQVLAELNRKELIISNFSFQTPSIDLQMEGRLKEISNVFIKPSLKMDLNLKVDLSKVGTLLLSWLKTPILKGFLHLKGQMELEASNWVSQNFDLIGTQLSIAGSQIGEIKIKGQILKDRLILPEIEVGNHAGKLFLTKTEIQFLDNSNELGFSIQSHLKSDQINLHKLFELLNLGSIPVFLDLASDLDCTGPLWPTTDIKCNGVVNGNNLRINSDGDNIVKINQMQANGEVEITQNLIAYKTQLQMGDSKGESSGVIDYKEGFKISFSSPEVNFKNVQNLADLKIEGTTKLSGSTEGNSNKAVFSISFDGKNVHFQDFFLGDCSSNLSYAKGLLSFIPLKGVVGTSEYQAKVSVDLREKRIAAEGKLAKFETSDLLKIFSRMYQSPIEMTGVGTAYLKASGPLKLGALTYDLSAQIRNGSAAGEFFERAELELSAVDGEVQIHKARLSKKNSSIVLSGVGHPDGNIKATIEGNNFLLEESENVNRLGTTLAGLFNFTLTLNGPILAPDAMFQGKFSNIFIEDIEVPASQVMLKLNRSSIEGSAQLIGNRLKMEFQWPLQPEAPFYLKIQAQDWNYASLFALIGGGSLLPEYQTTLSGHLNLASERGGIFVSTGSGQIQNFLLKRGNLILSNHGPMEFSAKNGIVSLTNFKLIGDKAKFEILGNQFSSKNLDLQINLSSPLRLFQIFLPFLEEFSGLAYLEVNVGGRIEKPEVFGDAKIEDGFVKLKSFPHPFEKIEGQAQFSQTNVSISNIKGQLAGGVFAGDGNIQIKGLRDLPVQIKAQVQNINLNVPDHVRTSGNADIMVSGNWFPFVLSGIYRVNNGKIDKEFTSDRIGTSLRQSSYLPKVILQSAFEPIVLDIQVNLEKGVNIKNSLMEGLLKGNIQVKGVPNSPILLGRITTEKSSKLFFRDTPFEIINSSIDLKDPSEVNPELFISARTRKSDYDVNLLIQGNAKNPILRLSSMPPLSEQDIISLLALGITSQRLEKKAQSREQENATGYTIGNAILSSNPLTKDLQEKTGFNLQFSSQYDDTKNSSVQKITVSRKLSEKVNVSASTLRGEQRSTEVKLQYDINQSISAVGSWESREATESNSVNSTQKNSDSILGLDLEFKKEFR